MGKCSTALSQTFGISNFKAFSMASCRIDNGFSERSSRKGKMKTTKMRGQLFSGDNSKKSRVKLQFFRFYTAAGDLMQKIIMSKVKSNDDGGAYVLHQS